MKRFRILSIVFALWLSVFNGTASAEQSYNWVEGGQPVKLEDMATLDLDPSMVFLNKEDTMQIAKDNNDTPSGDELGSIYPADENQMWEVLFRYEETGHIKDDEKEEINADDILESYKKGTEEANKERPEGTRIYVTGWDVEPFYDEATHNLTWSMLAEDDNKEQILNYNVRLLTRTGTISAILISDPEHLNEDKKTLTEKVLPKLTINAGKKYEDFNAATDKVSKLGLTGLILGGAGLVVAKKAGLIAIILLVAKKFGIVILLALGAVGKLFSKLFRRKKSATEETEPTPDNSEENVS
ncbi:DUF2167 domain-containing protein [Paenibacillus durus]|uniref:Membrane-anchored protein n=1 Tax=Paenibacillus durus ATCC 35681 TaxID=1333534 RepID=A0A0F7FD10_PAEDU|nr:DUF2167 domain-containing protein [Paenibacillus durus]AKG36799.1 membrane-anchored protein [Paenibacillus durus ATCC 35681]